MWRQQPQQVSRVMLFPLSLEPYQRLPIKDQPNANQLQSGFFSKPDFLVLHTTAFRPACSASVGSCTMSTQMEYYIQGIVRAIHILRLKIHLMHHQCHYSILIRCYSCQVLQLHHGRVVFFGLCLMCRTAYCLARARPDYYLATDQNNLNSLVAITT